MTTEERKRQRHHRALFVGLAGFLFVFFSLYFLNHIEFLKKENHSTKTKFDVVKANKKKKLNKKTPRKQAKRAKAKKMKPILDLDFAAGGVDLGIDVLGLGMRDSGLLSSSGDEVLTEDVVDSPPVVTHREPLVYPAEAIEKKQNGHVTLNILINKSGQVGKVKVVDSRPAGLFEQAALLAVKGWLFRPAELKGRAVSVWMKQKIQFKLD